MVETIMPNQAMHIVGGRMSGTPSPGIKLIEGDWPVDIDADGVLEGTSNFRKIVIDLSECLAYRLGKQIPMTANFRINYLRVGLRNVDDANDNDGPNYFAGEWEWYAPNKHRIDGVQAWRMLEKKLEEDDTDGEGLFIRNEDRYRGLRFGWLASTDVSFATQGAPAGPLPTGYALAPMLAYYNQGLKNEGTPTAANAIWDRNVGRSSRMGWSASVTNGEFIDQSLDNDPVNVASIKDYEWVAPAGHNIEVMGGLLVLTVTHSNTDTVQTFDDDFDFQIDIGVSGWSSW
jgi:hypothetical protein